MIRPRRLIRSLHCIHEARDDRLYGLFAGARKKAQELGVGSLIIRNFNRNKPVDWWQSTFCWVWDGFTFRKNYSLSEEKWKVDRLTWSQASVLRRFRLDNP